jgi:hypothetical protein
MTNDETMTKREQPNSRIARLQFGIYSFGSRHFKAPSVRLSTSMNASSSSAIPSEVEESLILFLVNNDPVAAGDSAGHDKRLIAL